MPHDRKARKIGKNGANHSIHDDGQTHRFSARPAAFVRMCVILTCDILSFSTEN